MSHRGALLCPVETATILSMTTFDETKQNKRLELLRLKEEEELARMLSQKYGLEYSDLSRESVNTDALRLIPEKKARQAEIAAISKYGSSITIAVRTPNNVHINEVVRELEKRGYKVTLRMASLHSLERVWNHYKDISFAVETEAGVLDVSGEEIKNLLAQITSLEQAREAIQKVLQMKRIYRITRTLETTIASGLANHASDVHIEPEQHAVRMRFRLDGVLTNIIDFERETYELLLSRVKLLSGLKINVKDAPQDGRFSVRIDDMEIEIRTSILPGAYGESIVLRLLDPHSIIVPFKELGMTKQVADILLHEISKPNGMVLNTGPTGSGKTTTLYAFLNKIKNPNIKIITIEDPIEYHVPGIVQTQTNNKDYTFESGLRSTLRQDPDVIMVGEIRDHEVASTAINAALTGHLVFSTLHTNSASGAFPRLIDLGVQPEIIGSAVNVVMAQRLVRRIDERHRKEVPLAGADRELVERVLSSIHNRSLVPAQVEHVFTDEAPGSEPGYKGRVGVYEAVLMTREIETAVRESKTIRELQDIATPQGVPTMYQDAILKVVDGITTLDEVKRVLGDDPEAM